MNAFDDLPLLRSFISIVESGSISGGARRLRTSQPTLSRQLRTLEERSGMILLRRDTRQMSLTDAGQRLLADERALVSQAEAADQRLRGSHQSLSGHLRLFATMDLGQWIVTRLVSGFLEENPGVTASLALTNRPLHMIQEGCDVGVLPGKITDESVIARPAGAISLHLAASPEQIRKHPPAKKPSDVAAWPWVSLEGAQFWGPREITLFDARGRSQKFPISPVLTSEGVTSVREAVKAGLGISLLPDWLIAEDLEAGRLVRVLPQWKARDLPVHVVYAGQRLLPLRVSAFIDFAVRRMLLE